MEWNAPPTLKTSSVLQVFLNYRLPWSCHRICSGLQPANYHWGVVKLRKHINLGAYWRDADFDGVWVLTTYIMSTFSNNSVISWPQKHTIDASYRKTAAAKRGCVSSYHKKKKIHKLKQMWTTIISLCLPQQREQICLEGKWCKALNSKSGTSQQDLPQQQKN